MTGKKTPRNKEILPKPYNPKRGKPHTFKRKQIVGAGPEEIPEIGTNEIWKTVNEIPSLYPSSRHYIRDPVTIRSLIYECLNVNATVL